MHKKTICVAISLILALSLLAGCSLASSIKESPKEMSIEEESESDSLVKETVAELSGDFKTIELETVEKEDGSFDHRAKLNGNELNEYDYTWHVDPDGTYDETDDSPAEYYTGTKPENDDIYIAHDIYYYPVIDESKFEKVNYDGETEWVTYYQSEEYKDYIFGTLPLQGNDVPVGMMHTAEDAYDNAVLHIEEAGTYKLSGDWHGQIYIDLGDDAKEDPNAVVTLILDNANIDCTVAPGVIFKEVYECDMEWEDREAYSSNVDTSKAGANIIIADGTDNTIKGTNIYRMLKTKLKDEDSNDAVPVQKKIRKNDGALYSYMSMNIYGENKGSGILNVKSENEGIDTELHLTIYGGTINIYSQDDGINTNEDDVSVTAINGGDIRIVAGLGFEGDGIDSNGYIVINGGKVISLASPMSDCGFDSSCGTFINGGEVLGLGSNMDRAESDDSCDTSAVTMNLGFSSNIGSEETLEVMDENDDVVFSYNLCDDSRVSSYKRNYNGAILSCDKLEIGKTYTLWIGGKQQGYTSTASGGFGGGIPPQMRNGNPPSDMPEGMTPPDSSDVNKPADFNGKMPKDFNGEKPQNSNGDTPPEFNGEKPQNGGDGTPPEFNGEKPQNGGNGTPPEFNGEKPQNRDGGTPPEFNGEKPQNGDGVTPPEFNGEMQQGMNNNDSTAEPISEFVIENKVNNFYGIRAV